MSHDIVRGAFAIFCDDYRQEVTGQETLVGVYGAEVTLTELPAALPQLVIIISAWCAFDDLFEECEFIATMNDIEIYRSPVGKFKEALEENRKKLGGQLKSGPENRVLVRIVHRIVPFFIEKPGSIRAHVNTGRELLRAGSLKILGNSSGLENEIPLAETKTLIEDGFKY